MKKFLSVLLAILLVFGVSTMSAFAAGNSYSTATKVSFGKTYKDVLTTGWEEDFFKFTVSETSEVNLEFTSEISLSLFLYNSDNERVWNSGFIHPDGISGLLTYSEEFYLSPGTYYFVVGDTFETGDYSFELNTTNNNSDSGSDNSSGGTGFFLLDILYFIVGFIWIFLFGY